jgi:general secretion pathway protein K
MRQPARGPGSPAREQEGFALLAVLLVLALLGVVGAEFAFSMRLEASMVRSYKEGVLATHLAEAGVEQAIREVLSDWTLVGYPDDGPLTFYPDPADPLPRLPRADVALGSGQFSYRITDEEGRLDVNSATPERLDQLLRVLGLERRERETIVDSIQDWKDANEDHRANGAESEDTYLKLPVPYRSRNAALTDLAELLQVHGVTPAIYYGHDDAAALRDSVTVNGSAQVNINTAAPIVLRALGLSDAEVSDVVQARQVAPYPSVPGKYTGRGFSATTATFRIESVGLVGGRPQARVVAIVRKPSASTAARAPSGEATVLSWNPNVDPASGASVR